MPRLKELDAERARLQDESKSAGSDVIEIYPAVADHYRTMVRDLRATLAERSSEQKPGSGRIGPRFGREDRDLPEQRSGRP